MLISTQGLVLHTTKYSETSIIAKVFTRQLGVKSYIVKGVCSSRSRVKQNLLQPLSYLDMVVYNNPKSTLNHIKEMKPAVALTGIAIDTVRVAMVFFLNELLYKTLREEEPNPELFDYTVRSMTHIDQSPHLSASLPILYLIQISHFLGIEPLDNYSRHEPLFNLVEGRFLAPPSRRGIPSSNEDYFLDVDASIQLHYYLTAAHGGTPCPQLPLESRISLIGMLLQYYQTHLTDFKNFKSHEVLHAVLQ